ncbi:MAG: 4Fe-4S binding protein [Actinomycetota bacterium]|nr:4Fe-4S binding protein [Actinomycetota bacterium]
MALVIGSSCIGCGGCELACPREAIYQGDGSPVSYLIDPLLCDDCARCIGLCPIEVIEPDPELAVCMGRGCPLASRRYAGWTCSQGRPRCPECGGMLWTEPGGNHSSCPECDAVLARPKAACPKVRHVRRAKALAAGRNS